MKHVLFLLGIILFGLSPSAQEKVILTIDGKERIVFDSSHIMIKNNAENIFIGDSTGYSNTLGIENIALGSKALYKNLFGSGNMAMGSRALYSNLFGDANIAIGASALISAVNASGNQAIGFNALVRNISGSFNVALGHSAMFSCISGSDNVAIGSVALQNNIAGLGNVAIGAGAMRNDSIGAENVAIGFNAMGNNFVGCSNIAIGYAAAQNDTGSYRLYIDHGYSASPLIYGEFDNDIVRINGELQVGTAFRFPTAAGIANQLLKTGGSGQLSWQNDQVDDADASPVNELLDSVTLNYPILELYEGGLPPYIVDLGLLIDDADADPTNELIDSAALNFPFLELYEGGLPPYLVDLGLLIDDADADPINELQTLSTSNDSIYILNGNGIKLPMLTITSLIDADADTKIELIENGATDIIGFTVDGKQVLGVDSTRIQFFNNLGNTIIGQEAGQNMNGGSSNTFLGKEAGRDITSGSGNTFIGRKAGIGHSTGSNNTFLGRGAGLLNVTGSQNVFIGRDAGSTETGSNKLYIDNSNTANPLIYGEFEYSFLKVNGDFMVAGEVRGDLNVRGNMSVKGSNLNFSVEADTALKQVCIKSPILNINNATSVPLKIEQTGEVFAQTMLIDPYSINTTGGLLTRLNLQEYGGDVNIGDSIMHINGSDKNVRIHTMNPLSTLHVVDSNTAGLTGITRVQNLSAQSVDVIAIDAESAPADYYGYGGRFKGGYIGLQARVDPTGENEYFGLRGICTGGSGTNYGVYGEASGTGTSYGVYSAGDLAYTGSLINASDARFKKEILTVDGALSKIMALKPKSYAYRSELFPGMHLGDGRHFGFLAQELEAVLPELVHNDAFSPGIGQKDEMHNSLSDEKMKGVNYVELIPILTRAIQEQQEAILEQKEVILRLEERVVVLENK